MNYAINIKINDNVTKALSSIKNKLDKVKMIVKTELKIDTKQLDKMRDKTINIIAKVKTIGKIKEFKNKTVELYLKLTNLDNVKRQISDIKTKILSIMPIIASLAIPIKQSMDFELQFVDVSKVFNGTKDELKGIKKLIFDIASKSSATVKDITAITAKGIGTGKIPLKDMRAFIELANKSKVAFDISSLEMGKSMDTVLSKLGYGVSDMSKLFDMLNYSTNISSSKMKEMLNILSRVGGTLKSFKTAEIATLINFSTEKGVSPETTATSINSIVNSLKSLDTKKLSNLGFKGLDNGANVFAQGKGYEYLYSILQKISNIKDPTAKFKTITSIFGKGEQKNLIENFLNDMNGFKKRYEQITLKSNWANSVSNEFKQVEATSIKKIEKFKGLFNILMIKIGDSFLTMVNKILSFINPLMEKLVSFANTHKALFSTILKGLTVVAMLGTAFITVKLALLGLSFGLSGMIPVIVTVGRTFLMVFGSLSIPILAVVATLGLVYYKWGSIVAGFKGAIGIENLKILSNTLSTIWGYLKFIGTIISFVFTRLITMLTPANDKLSQTSSRVSALSSVFRLLGTVIGLMVRGAIVILSKLSGYLNTIANKIIWVINKIRNIKLPNLSKIGGSISHRISNGYGSAKKYISNIFSSNKTHHKTIHHYKQLAPVGVSNSSHVDLNVRSANGVSVGVSNKSKWVNVKNLKLD